MDIDSLKKEYRRQMRELSAELSVLTDKLKELELQNRVVDLLHVSLQLSEEFSPIPWKDAMDLPRQLNEKNYLGHNDWYLPAASELVGIMETGWKPRKTNKRDFQNDWQRSHIWSKTRPSSRDSAFKVDFEFASVNTAQITLSCSVICVRVTDRKDAKGPSAPPSEVAGIVINETTEEN